MLHWIRSVFSSLFTSSSPHLETERPVPEVFQENPDVEPTEETESPLNIDEVSQRIETESSSNEYILIDFIEVDRILSNRRRGPSRERVPFHPFFTFMFSVNNELNRLNSTLSLESLAQDEEGATKPLNAQQKTAISQLEEKYRLQFNEKGRKKLLCEIKTYLQEQYLKSDLHTKNNLPLDYSPSLTEVQKKAYYQNIYHTAIRYLFWQPNPLISPKALWTKRHKLEGASADIDEYDLKILLNLWLAINDPDFVFDAPMTRDDLLLEFVRLLDYLGRGHNRDTKRRDASGKLSYFDDLQGDKPICKSGLRQNTSQFLMLNCAQILKDLPIEVNDLKESVRERIIAHVVDGSGLFDRIEKMDVSQLKTIFEALKRLVALGNLKELMPAEQEILKQALSVPKKICENLFDFYKKFYGEEKIKQPSVHPIRYYEFKFNSYEGLIHYFLENIGTVYYNEISEKIEKRIAGLEKESKASPRFI